MKLFIKNMVCHRCKMVVKSELEKLGLHYTSVELGEIKINENISPGQFAILKTALRESGLELMDDHEKILAEKIKSAILELIHQSDEEIKIQLSSYLSEKLNHSYAYLAGHFHDFNGITIEKFFLSQKIEKVKDLLVYSDLSLTEIAYRLNYSSVAHLSAQFKKTTGLAPSQFKNLKYNSKKDPPMANIQ